MEDFAEETDIFGLNLMRPRIGKVEKVFWILCVIVCICLTARELHHLTVAYQSEATVTVAKHKIDFPMELKSSPTLALLNPFRQFTFDAVCEDEELRAAIASLRKTT